MYFTDIFFFKVCMYVFEYDHKGSSDESRGRRFPAAATDSFIWGQVHTLREIIMRIGWIVHHRHYGLKTCSTYVCMYDIIYSQLKMLMFMCTHV